MKTYKISISGKANSGKNTLSRLLAKELKNRLKDNWNGVRYIAFADPIKEMARTMFPNLPRKYFYGASKFRNEIIPNAFYDDKPLKIRDLLIILGTKVGRTVQKDIWLNNFDYKVSKLENLHHSLIICPDQRFINEFYRLKNNNFYQIRLLRENSNKLNDVSETEQENLSDNQYNWIVNNNGSKSELKKEVVKIIDDLLIKYQ